MSKLEFLNGFFTERLIAAADEIFQVVKDTISEYQEEINRAKQENRYLREMLVSINSSGEERRVPTDIPSCPADGGQTSQGPPDSEPIIQVKLELCTVEQERELQQPLSVAPCTTTPMDTDLDQDPLPSLPVKSMDTEERECSDLLMDPVPVKTEQCDSQDPCTDSSAAQREPDHFEVDEDDPSSRSSYRPYGASSPDRPPQTQSDLADSLFYCKVCNKPFKTYLWLEKHLASHSNEERHVCGVCGKRFKLAQTLESHIHNHTRERPHCCRFCGKGFSQKSHVRDHERIHTGEKPFVCPICQKGFVQRSQLMTHIHTHSYLMKDLSEVKQWKKRA